MRFHLKGIWLRIGTGKDLFEDIAFPVSHIYESKLVYFLNFSIFPFILPLFCTLKTLFLKKAIMGP